MFFTVKSIEGFVIDQEGFIGFESELQELLSVLTQAYKVCFVAQYVDDFSRFNIQQAIYTPQSLAEVGLFQNVIRRAILAMGCAPTNTVFLSRGAKHLRDAHELLLGTIAFVSRNTSDYEMVQVFQEFPDFIVKDKSELERALSGENVGFGGEFAASPNGVFIFDSSKVRICEFPNVPNQEHQDCPVYVAGRYFDTTDPRHSLHALSTRIVRSKRKPEAQASCFADLFMRGSWYATQGNVEAFTRVPPRPGDTDRLGLYLSEIEKSRLFVENKLSNSTLRPDFLQCIRKYPTLKFLNYQQRREAVAGAFAASAEVRGKRVALLDDVQTTGATLNECIKVLKEAGVQAICPVVLGYHPYGIQTLGLSDEQEIRCSDCQGRMVARCNGSTGVPFYGCSNWKPGGRHSSMHFDRGLSRKLELMALKVMEFDEELAAGDIGF